MFPDVTHLPDHTKVCAKACPIDITFGVIYNYYHKMQEDDAEAVYMVANYHTHTRRNHHAEGSEEAYI